jgi:hypothetical protein
MVADMHPGPDAPEVPFVLEDIQAVLLWVEARIDKTLSFHSFRVYMRDPFGFWGQVTFTDPGSRRFKLRKAQGDQGAISQLWDQRFARSDRPRRLNS